MKFKTLCIKKLANHEIQNALKRLANHEIQNTYLKNAGNSRNPKCSKKVGKIHWDLRVPTTVLLRLKVSDNRFDDRCDRFAPT